MNDFETKLAAAGETFEKLAAERGLSISDFNEQETFDILSTIMGEGGPEKTASDTTTPAAAAPAAPAAPAVDKTASATPAPQLTYGQVMAEVVKVASANGYDINKATPAELDDAVQKMAALLSDPGYMQKQAALREKIAEADAMGRVMAHSYVDELGKIAAKTAAEECKDDKKKEEEEKAEKKAALARALQAKTASATPAPAAPAAAPTDIAKLAALRAEEHLVLSGVNPATGEKFASQEEAVDAAAALILRQKGYTLS